MFVPLARGGITFNGFFVSCGEEFFFKFRHARFRFEYGGKDLGDLLFLGKAFVLEVYLF